MGLIDWLRGGGPARSKRLEGFGLQLSSTAAAGLTLLSVASVCYGLPWGLPGMAAPSLSNSYWFARIAFLRGLSLIYLVAFVAAYQQNIALIGDHGLLPARLYLRRIREAFQAPSPRAVTWAMAWAHPTLLWLAPPDRLDPYLRGLAAAGALLSAAVLVLGASAAPVQLALWVLYHAIVAVGQRWYSFGWESQVPAARARPAPRRRAREPPPPPSKPARFERPQGLARRRDAGSAAAGACVRAIAKR